MEKFIIRGGVPLHGTVRPAGNKNSAFPLISAALLTDEPVTLHNLPDIGDVRTMLTIVAELGAEITHLDPHTVTIQAKSLHGSRPDPGLFGNIRGALVLMGSLLARTGQIELTRPGGDQIGRRRIDTHIIALKALGAEFQTEPTFRLAADSLVGSNILLDEASVTATENVVMAAVTARGQSVIRNAASEPHVQQLCLLLKKMGAQIKQIGSDTLIIDGVEKLHGAEHSLDMDYLEVVSFIGAAVTTGGELRLEGAASEHLAMTRLVFGRLGVHWNDDGADIIVPAGQELRVMPDLGGHIPKIDDGPWPAFPADLMSIAIVVATQASGTVLFHEKMFESRLFFVDKLIGMGAQIVLCDPHRCIVQGPIKLRAEEQGISSPDIRAGMALILAALCAEGVTTISNIGQIDRGYERVEDKLRSLGAEIERRDD